MKKLILSSLLLAFYFLAGAQSKINYLEFPKNTISIAPFNGLINGNDNGIYYKRMLNRSENDMIYVRLGTGLFETFSFEKTTQTGSPDSYRQINFRFGLEFYKKLGNFSLSFGPELSYSHYLTKEATISPTSGSIFSTNAITLDPWNAVEECKISLVNIIGFFGLKYHLNKNIQFGIESAIGFGFYNIATEYYSSFNEELKGNIKNITANRQITIEYNF